jgi:hypothetical protein
MIARMKPPTIKKYLDTSNCIDGRLMASAWQEGDGPWFGLVTFIASHPGDPSESHHTKGGYSTAHEAIGAANALSVELFPPGHPRTRSISELKALEADGEIDPFFKQLHHWAMPDFKSSPTTWADMVRCCNGLSVGVRPDAENERTLQRIYRFVEPVRSGTYTGNAAVTEAWRVFPLASA